MGSNPEHLGYYVIKANTMLNEPMCFLEVTAPAECMVKKGGSGKDLVDIVSVHGRFETLNAGIRIRYFSAYDILGRYVPCKK